jgi:peptide/nickel transport system permease protein
MARYALMRIVHAIPVLVILSMIVFSMILLIPGDPVNTYLGETNATPEQIHAMKHKLGLDQPIPVQYIDWAGRVLHGNLGESVSSHQPVLGTLLSRLPITIELALIATLIAVVIAIPLGVVAALRRKSFWDTMLSTISVGGLAVPNFCFAVLLIVLFAVKLHWLPSSGYVPFSQDPVANLKRMILPALALGIAFAGVLARQIRSSLIEVLSQDYVRTARAKGISERRVVWRHAIPNALIAPLTVLGVHLGHLLGGVLIIETIFALPGEGSYVVTAISTRDYQVVQGGALLIGVIVILVNIATDILYGVIDPRITVARAEQ